jgi:hypothetical protein
MYPLIHFTNSSTRITDALFEGRASLPPHSTLHRTSHSLSSLVHALLAEPVRCHPLGIACCPLHSPNLAFL